MFYKVTFLVMLPEAGLLFVIIQSYVLNARKKVTFLFKLHFL